MQMEPTAVKGEDFPLPGTVSLHSVEVRAETFCEWRDWLCSGISAPLQFAGRLSLHPADLELSLVNSEASFCYH